MEHSGNKKFIRFQLRDVLNNGMESHAILLHSAHDKNHPFI